MADFAIPKVAIVGRVAIGKRDAKTGQRSLLSA
jgi:hypothetical protein